MSIKIGTLPCKDDICFVIQSLDDVWVSEVEEGELLYERCLLGCEYVKAPIRFTYARRPKAQTKAQGQEENLVQTAEERYDRGRMAVKKVEEWLGVMEEQIGFVWGDI
ncbi:hypothetical protein L484_017750 [Morus notabilis]|uniref:Uncharacterized protein n=1 Tax=Morus notabilis TaxID=981085 RepID=W9RRM9_9ROSA|nr:hypothetical protein L484_017750 [Morus notabilis]